MQVAVQPRYAAPRVVAYIDGLNLHFGLRAAGRNHLQWIDLWRFSELLAGKNRRLERVHYFVAPFVRRHADQRNYLGALEIASRIETHLGYHLTKINHCRRCGSRHETFEEKLTDVKIALKILCDAEDDRFDVALLVSADGDFAAVIETVLERHPQKRVIVAFPPGLQSDHLAQVASARIDVWTSTLRNSQLPDIVTRDDGLQFARPERWRR